MATNKKSFVAYADWLEIFEELEDHEAGQLVKHMLRYVNDKNPEAENKLVKLAFVPIKQALKRDLRKWEGYVEKQKANGLKGGRPKANETQKTQAFSEKPKKADSVNVSVNANVSDNVNANENKKNKTLMSEASASDVTEKNREYFDISKAYYQLFEKNAQTLDVTWTHLRKISAKKFIDPIRLMLEVDNRTRDDMRLVWHFLQKDDFWMKNIQSSAKLRENFDQLITKAKNEGIKKNGQSISRTRAFAAVDPRWNDR